MTLLALALIVAGVLVARASLRGLPAVLEVLRIVPRRVASLVADDVTGGVVDLAGEIEVATPAVTMAGVAAALVTTTVFSYKSVDDKSPIKQQRTVATDAVLLDGHARCLLDVEGAEVVGDVYEGTSSADDFLSTCPDWAASLCDGAAVKVRVAETLIPRGARVLVSGEVRKREDATPDGYRDGVTAPFAIGGSDTRALLISEGTRARFVRHAILPVVLGALIGAWLISFGAVCLVAAVLD